MAFQSLFVNNIGFFAVGYDFFARQNHPLPAEFSRIHFKKIYVVFAEFVHI